MPVTQSSITAYNQEVRSGKIPTQRQRILDLLMEGQPMTRRMIGKILNMELGAVSGRVNALIKSDLVKEAYYGMCPHSGKRVQFIEVVWPQPKQKEFGW